MNLELPPLRRGQRQDIGEAITAYCDYQQSGTFRDELAQKMIYAQLQLAQRGFSTGGRANFGFRRNLVNGDGTVIRQLSDGEIVRQKGHHVVLLPGPPEELDLIQRILGMLEKTPACRVARILNAEGIPSPDAGRKRRDNGIAHNVSGVWHSSTITNIARNPLIRALTSYGRRSMGDRCRTSLEGPRQLDASDFGANEKPKVVQNPESQQVSAPAYCSPLVPLEQSERLLKILDQRAGTQKGKPRSRDPQRNPLGGRVFDIACAWPMYRVPRSGSFAYTCGYYQQTHGQSCSHNHIDGPTATRFALAAVRQFLFKPGMLKRLEVKLRSKSKSASAAPSEIEAELSDKRIELEKINRQLTIVKRNLSLAENQEAFKAIESFFVELQAQRADLEGEIAQLETKSPPRYTTSEELIQAALAQIGTLPTLADAHGNLPAIGELFRRINLQMFLRFQPIKKTKRVVNQLSGGVLPIGAAPAPIEKYVGPTGRRALQSNLAYNEKCPLGDPSGQMSSLDSDGTAESLGNVNRDDRI
ncbi:MAG: recombinase family protein [Fuerstia sp.]|nr:recombinase family protein [Fuerstiella sp.]